MGENFGGDKGLFSEVETGLALCCPLPLNILSQQVIQRRQYGGSIGDEFSVYNN